jgi:hypothetical protein
MELADRLGTRHLAVRIRSWLAPLLPPDRQGALLQEARQMAAADGFDQLLQELALAKGDAGDETTPPFTPR